MANKFLYQSGKIIEQPTMAEPQKFIVKNGVPCVDRKWHRKLKDYGDHLASLKSYECAPQLIEQLQRRGVKNGGAVDIDKHFRITTPTEGGADIAISIFFRHPLMFSKCILHGEELVGEGKTFDDAYADLQVKKRLFLQSLEGEKEAVEPVESQHSLWNEIYLQLEMKDKTISWFVDNFHVTRITK